MGLAYQPCVCLFQGGRLGTYYHGGSRSFVSFAFSGVWGCSCSSLGSLSLLRHLSARKRTDRQGSAWCNACGRIGVITTRKHTLLELERLGNMYTTSLVRRDEEGGGNHPFCNWISGACRFTLRRALEMDANEQSDYCGRQAILRGRTGEYTRWIQTP